MKKTFLFTAFAAALITLSGTGTASDDFASNFKRKEQSIRTKMEYAQKHGNKGQLRGLEKALGQIRQWCSDDDLRSRAELRVMEKRDKVEERQADLNAAITEGKGKAKIAKLQRKLEEAKEELDHAVAERDELIPLNQ